MEKELKFIAEKVLKRKTNVFLKEIDDLMTENGVGTILARTNVSKKDRAPGRSQFKALMDAAGEASCIEELLLFLSYQESKDGGWKNICSNKKNIAKNLTDSFMKIQDIIYADIVDEAKEKEISSEDERILRLEIAKKYMGYLFWKASVVSRY